MNQKMAFGALDEDSLRHETERLDHGRPQTEPCAAARVVRRGLRGRLLSDLFSYGLTNEEDVLSRTFFGVLLMLVLAGGVTLALSVQQVRAQANGTITINADGSITPSTAPISSSNNITYKFTANVNSSIIVSRSNIVLDGSGYALKGSGSGDGVSLTSISNVSIINMNITGFEYGVYLSSSSHDTIFGNTLASNSANGVYLVYSSNNTISRNNATANGCGIYLFSCSDNNVTWNNATANYCGIYLGYSSRNIVSANNVTANSSSGIYLSGSSGNVFYHNNFIDNTEQVSSDGSPNTWNIGYPSGGNYWSDYQSDYPNAAENDHSGTWNTPYIIDNNNTDYYPLVQPWPASFTSTPEFPSLMTLPLIMITTLLAVLVFEKRQNAKTRAT